MALLSFALLLSLPLPAFAWNAAGHRLVACIAWDHLDEHSRREVARLLREHPDYSRWLNRNVEPDENKGVFIESSTWPDEIRNDPRFYNAGLDQPTIRLAGFPDMERRRNWHYLNRPLDSHQRRQPVTTTGLLDIQLVALGKALASPATPEYERSYALPWLVHLAGDAHQPLHTSIRLNADGKWDKLGNGLTVINPNNSRKPSTTLHAFWDDLPGPSRLRGERLNARCRALSVMYPRPAPSVPNDWIDESWALAVSSAYPPGNGSELTISPAFYEYAREIADRRVAQAGYRLADLLRDLFNTRSQKH